ncbi:Kelch repeat-containing protein [candidate division CSSED10-310 bacterium]|uniref:Kelch repeat-containing protein n=1 Tax=candidate division CSSED10-310 bacterium TaxID=2855610 RepID=A0ABV6YTM8_UNCC1
MKKWLIYMMFFTCILWSCADDDDDETTEVQGPSARRGVSIAYAGDNRVVLFGGEENPLLTVVNDTWIYDTLNFSWTEQTPGNNVPAARLLYNLISSKDGTVFLIGGRSLWRESDTVFYHDSWIYDPNSNTWVEQSAIPNADLPLVAYAGEDTLFLISCWFGDTVFYEYSISGDSWSRIFTAPFPEDREGPVMAYAGGTKVVLFGGYTFDAQYNPVTYENTWEYDTSTHQWIEYNHDIHPSGRISPGLTYAGGTKVILYSGTISDESDFPEDYMWEYDTSTHIWNQITVSGTRPVDRTTHAMTYIEDGKIILFGGYREEEEIGGIVLNDTWEYDIASKKWTERTQYE